MYEMHKVYQMTKINNSRKNQGYTVPKILVIDDEKLIRWSLKEILAQEGYDVDTIDSAGEAIKLAKDIPYDLIIADLEIQDENGIEMLKRIKEFRPEVKTIILSAHPKLSIQPEFGDLEVLATIEKPFKSDQLLSIAKKVLHSVPFRGEEIK
jgi:DNA-binding NtrC family response regulator